MYEFSPAVYRSVGKENNPTDPYTISEPQMASIAGSEQHKTCRSTDFEARKLWKGRLEYGVLSLFLTLLFRVSTCKAGWSTHTHTLLICTYLLGVFFSQIANCHLLPVEKASGCFKGRLLNRERKAAWHKGVRLSAFTSLSISASVGFPEDKHLSVTG